MPPVTVVIGRSERPRVKESEASENFLLDLFPEDTGNLVSADVSVVSQLLDDKSLVSVWHRQRSYDLTTVSGELMHLFRMK